MKIGVLSDIHANLEALQAVDKELQLADVKRVISLGDMIGYGPDPQAVVAFVRARGYLGVLGNHEFALGDARARRWLNFQAAENNAISEAMLTEDNLEYCTSLPFSLRNEGGYFVHAYPPNSVFRYLYRQSDEKIVSLFARNISRIFFVGHTHRLQLIAGTDTEIVRIKLAEGKTVLAGGKNYIVNCGSVGQPRQRDGRANCIIWDSLNHQVELRCVDYDRERTIAKIRKLGFPEAYAMRLQLR